MKKIKINIPKGYTGTFDEKTSEITFVPIPKNPRERIKGWLDILDHHNMTKEFFNNWCTGLRPHEVGQREEEMIVAAYNGRQLEDPLPVWGDGTGYKRYPLFNMPTPSGSGFSFNGYVDWRSSSDVGSRQVFFGDESYENLIDATTKFIKQYELSRTL